MKKLHIFIATIIMTLIGFLIGNVTGFIAAYKNINSKEDNQETTKEIVITSSTVVERLKEQSFLVTKSIISEQQSVITVDQGSTWSNIWWGKKVTAKANVQTDLGIDLTKIKNDNIEVDNEDQTIVITLPKAEEFNVTVIGDIEASSSYGLFEKLFANDPNGDYNLAKEQLEKEARNSVGNNPEYLKNVQESSAESIMMILSPFNYEVSFEIQEDEE